MIHRIGMWSMVLGLMLIFQPIFQALFVPGFAILAIGLAIVQLPHRKVDS